MFKHVGINDKKTWDFTLSKWKKEVRVLGDEGVFLALDIEKRFLGLKQLAGKESNVHGYFLVKKKNTCASSLLEVAHALPNFKKPWLKLLQITLRPSLLPASNGGKVSEEAAKVLVNSVSHAIDLIYKEHPSSELKVYGRTLEMKALFDCMVESPDLIKQMDNIGLGVKTEGNWLIILKKNGK